MKFNNKGFAHFELLIVVISVLVIGFVGYRIVKVRQTAQVPTNTSTVANNPSQGEPTSAPEIKSTADLTTASTEVDKLNPDSDVTEVSKLETDVNNL